MCNRYKEGDAKSSSDSLEKSRSALKRYLFFSNRYMNHLQSLKLEAKLHNTVKVSSCQEMPAYDAGALSLFLNQVFPLRDFGESQLENLR